MQHHGAGLLQLKRDQAWVDTLKNDYTQADLTAPQRAMLDYAAKLTRAPWAMEQQDIAALRTQGFSDRAILDINQIVAYFAFVNRIADGLGVQMEDYWDE